MASLTFLKPSCRTLSCLASITSIPAGGSKKIEMNRLRKYEQSLWTCLNFKVCHRPKHQLFYRYIFLLLYHQQSNIFLVLYTRFSLVSIYMMLLPVDLNGRRKDTISSTNNIPPHGQDLLLSNK
jgi:hypothetical protein